MDIKVTTPAKNESPVQAFIEKIQNKQAAAQGHTTEDEPKTLKISDEISFTLPDTKSQKETKVDQILAKLYSGEELSPNEIQYISANSPENMQQVRKIIAERKQLEAMMKAAKTKSDAIMASATVMQIAVNSTDKPQEANQHINLIRGVFNDYIKTEEYKAKPDSMLIDTDSDLELAIKKASELIKESMQEEKSEADTNVEDTASGDEQVVLPPIFEDKTDKTNKSYEDKKNEEKLKRYKRSQFKEELEININI